ncbi:MAG: hypothetical protein ACXVHN_04590 [Methanobacterium sp.]
MEQNKIPVDEKATRLLKKCENEEIASQGMGACQVLLEEMDKGDMVIEDETGKSYIEMSKKIKSQSMENKDVPNVVRIAFYIRDSSDISDDNIKNAAIRLIRTIEAL